MNLDLFAVTSASSGMYGFSVRLGGAGGLTMVGSARSAVAASQVSFAANIRLSPHAASAQIRSWLANYRPDTPQFVCYPPVLLQTFAPHWAALGETGITAKASAYGVAQQFTYENGQSSSLGIGVSTPSGYSASGTYAISAGGVTPFPSEGGDSGWRYKSAFIYGEYDNGCKVWVQPYTYAGGSQLDTEAIPSANYCLSYLAHTSPGFNSNTAVTFSLGITIPEVGFTATAQTGWDHSASITYTTGAQNHDICGQAYYPDASYPAPSPQRIVMGLH